jgi:hypothetical protein
MKSSFFCLCLILPLSVLAQEDLLKELEQSSEPKTEYVRQTFKSTRLVNSQTVESKGKGELEFIFAHRFGLINDGIYELFGLDQAFVRIGLEYGLNDRWGVGFGRNSVDKTMDFYTRYKILQQSTGQRNMPVTVSAFVNTAIRTSPRNQDLVEPFNFEDRVSYTAQLLIARKFTNNLSLQLMPVLVHKNTVDRVLENNDQLALGMGGRYKITKSVALTSEYYYRFDVPDENPYYDAFGVGVDIETGGHVFQLVLSNTRGLTERAVITETSGDLGNGDLHFGFNVTRTFQLKKQK